MCICCNCCNNKFICLLILMIIYLGISFALYYFAAVSKFDDFKEKDECYKRIKDDPYLYEDYKTTNYYESTFEMLYELYPSIEPIYNLAKFILLIYSFLITFIFVIRSCKKMPKNDEPNFKCYRGLIYSVYIFSYFLLFGNLFYSIFLFLVARQFNSIRKNLECSNNDEEIYILDSAKSMLLISLLGNVFLFFLFAFNIRYLNQILKMYDNGDLPCQNFVNDYIIIDNEEFFSDKYDYLEDYNIGVIKKVRIF